MTSDQKLTVVTVIAAIVAVLIVFHICVVVNAHYDLTRLFGSTCVVIEVLEILTSIITVIFVKVDGTALLFQAG